MQRESPHSSCSAGSLPVQPSLLCDRSDHTDLTLPHARPAPSRRFVPSPPSDDTLPSSPPSSPSSPAGLGQHAGHGQHLHRHPSVHGPGAHQRRGLLLPGGHLVLRAVPHGLRHRQEPAPGRRRLLGGRARRAAAAGAEALRLRGLLAGAAGLPGAGAAQGPPRPRARGGAAAAPFHRQELRTARRAAAASRPERGAERGRASGGLGRARGGVALQAAAEVGGRGGRQPGGRPVGAQPPCSEHHVRTSLPAIRLAALAWPAAPWHR